MNQNLSHNKKIRQALGNVDPSMAATLIEKIENKRAKGYDDPTFDLILPFAREVLQSAGSKAARDATVLRSFCIPFEDMLVDNGPSYVQSGRINRHSIVPVWNWLATQLPAHLTQDISSRINEAVKAEDMQTVRAVCSVLYEEAADVLQAGFAAAWKDKGAKHDLEKHLGAATGLADAAEMLHALRNARIIGEIRDGLPASIERVAGSDLEMLTKLFAGYRGLLPGKPGIVAASFMVRMKNPGHMLRVASRIQGSSNGKIMASGPLAVIGDILLFDIERVVNDVVAFLRRGMPAADIVEKLQEFHQRIRDFTEEVEISPKGRWGKRLAGARVRISELLEAEIRQAPALMHEYIKNNGNRHNDFALPGAAVAAGTDNGKCETRLVRTMLLITGCKKFLDQLSINAIMRNVENDIQQAIDYARVVGKARVIDDLEKMMK